MNRLARELARVCQERLLEEKWLIAPSLRVGHQWLDIVTLAGGPVLNVRIKTLKGLALDLAGPEMARQGVSLITATGTLILVDRILNRLRSLSSGYLSFLPPSPTLSRTACSSIDALRLAGLNPGDLHPQCFEAPEKSQDLAFVLTEYLRTLDEKSLIDYAAALSLAADRMAKDQTALVAGVVVVLPEDLDLGHMEQRLVQAIPAPVLITLNVDRPGEPPDDVTEAVSDASLLRWLPSPATAPAPVMDGTAEIFRAVGEVNEVREVLRTCFSRGYKFDEVEILHTDSETYVPLIYELLIQPETEPTFDDRALPVSFAEGIPTRYSKPGRALTAWMAWLREGHLQATLARMIQDGLLDLSGMDREEFSFSGLATLFREVGIGLGQDRYIPKLVEKITEVQQEIDSGAHGGGTGRSSDMHTKAHRVKGLNILLSLVKRLLEVSPAVDTTTDELLAAAKTFLTELTRTDTELDNYALKALLDDINDMAFWTNQDPEPMSLDLWEWLSSLPGAVRVGGSGPRPGRLHVAHALSGGHSGRRHTFVIGLDDSRFPGSGLNDPLLLDEERGKLSPKLRKAAAELSLKIEKFAKLQSRLRGTVTLGYSCLNLQEDREMFPSPEVLSAYRILADNREGDQGDMMIWLPLPASFAPHAADRCLDEHEWWLWRLCGPVTILNARDAVGRHFPHLARGLIAAAARNSDEFTQYDGLLTNPSTKLDPSSSDGPVLSARRLETVGCCPLRYLFRYVLDISLPEELTVDLTRWLDPVEFGNLLHEVFYRFMSELIAERRKPLYHRDSPRLFKILDELVTRYEKLFPSPGLSAFRQQMLQLIRTAQIFLVEEEELCRHSKPLFLEASVGMPPYERSSPLDAPEPVAIPLPGGRTIRARGRIDRVDSVEDGAEVVFSIWDYKTGRPTRYEKQDYFWQGRVIQHALYIEMARAILKRKVSPGAEVSHFGYFFPGSGHRGIRIRRWRGQMMGAAEVIDRLCKILASGCFLPTNNAREDCPFCDYLLICGDTDALAAASTRKLQNSRNECLQPIRELRNIGI
ncbi:MAG: PD-(D/E)XK nuclease family protein [Desulfomonilaceae bacterium]